MVRMQGLSGELRRSYQVAAKLGAWQMNEDGRVCAEAEINEVMLEQSAPPLALWLTFGKSAWVWRHVEVVDAAAQMVLRVQGSPVVRSLE